MGASLKKAGLGKLEKRLAKIRHAVQGKSVVAGYIDGISSPASIEKAYKNEYGFISTDLKQRVPARPFMHMSVPLMKEALTRGGGIPFDPDSVDGYLAASGMVMEHCIRDSINTGNFVENAGYTIAMKHGDKPLVDSGEMMADAGFQVRGVK